MKYIPEKYQVEAKDYVLKNNKCFLAMGMGTGKTAIVLNAIKELRDEYADVGQVLVIAPKTVAESGRPDEVEKRDEFNGSLSIMPAFGTPAKRKQILETRADIHTIGRDNIQWLVKTFKNNRRRDMVVIDESSSFKSPSAKRFRALKPLSITFKRLVLLSGTPAPNGQMDLWAQFYLLDQGKRLENTITKYRTQYFNAFNFGGQFTDYKIKPEAKAIINDKISDISIHMSLEEHRPELKELPPIDIRVKLDPKERKLYETMEKEAVIELNGDDIAATHAAVVKNKLLQLANGAIYDEEGNYHTIHDKKLEALSDVIEAAQAEGNNVLVFYAFKSDADRILKKFKKAVKYEGSREYKMWNQGKIPILVASPASMGHGLNMQQGGHIAIWFGLNRSLELYQQANRRLLRPGQTQTVLTYRILADNTADDDVKYALEGKNVTQQAILDRIKKRVLKWEN